MKFKFCTWKNMGKSVLVSTILFDDKKYDE